MYTSWHDKMSSCLLWIHSKPRFGKSTLAGAIQRSLQHAERDYTTADFFYSSRGGPNETNHKLMLQSILFQLLDQNKRSQSLYNAFRASFRKLSGLGPGDIIWSYEEPKAVLLCLSTSSESSVHIDSQHKFLILIDGLDESEEKTADSPERATVLRLLSRLCSGNVQRIFKIIALSRVERGTTRYLKPTHSIDMKHVNKHDIEGVVRIGITHLRRCISFSLIIPLT